MNPTNDTPTIPSPTNPTFAPSESSGGKLWHKCFEVPPPQKRVVWTKIDDEHGWRNDAKLIFDGRLWWFADKSMYVYYTPTHWAEVTQ